MQGIYKITNVKTNKVYIGQSIDIEKRWKEHKRMLELNNHHSTKLQRSYNATKDKENTFKFEVIEEVENECDLLDRENYYIELYDSVMTGYNMVSNDKLGKKYTQKSINDNKNKEKKNKYYNEFYNILNEYINEISIDGTIFSDRLYNKHYSYTQYKTLIYIIKFILKFLYEDNNTTITFGYYCKVLKFNIYYKDRNEHSTVYKQNNELIVFTITDNGTKEVINKYKY